MPKLSTADASIRISVVKSPVVATAITNTAAAIRINVVIIRIAPPEIPIALAQIGIIHDRSRQTDPGDALQ